VQVSCLEGIASTRGGGELLRSVQKPKQKELFVTVTYYEVLINIKLYHILLL